jgi:hypothetical protein
MCAVSNTTVFSSSLKPCFPSVTLRYSLNDFPMGPFTPVIIDITFVFTFEFAVFLLQGIYVLNIFGFFLNAISYFWNMYFPFSLSRIMMSISLLGIFLSLRSCSFQV